MTPLYPPLLQMLRTTATTVPGPAGVAQVAGYSVLGPTLYVAFTQQLMTDSLLPRDREPCLVDAVSGPGLTPGFYLGRLAGSFNSLPVYEVTDKTTAAAVGEGNVILGTILLEDRKAAGTAGGTSTAGSWLTRDLTDETTDTHADCTLAANAFTLVAGTYIIKWRTPGFDGGPHRSRLKNVTATTYTYGSSADIRTVGQTDSVGFLHVVLAAAAQYKVEHWFQTACATYGLGVSTTDGEINVYTQVEICRLGTSSGGGGGLTSVGLVNALDDTATVSGSPLTANGDITLTAVDATADKVVGWDDSATKKIYFALGASLATTTTTVHISEGDKGDITTSGGAGNVWTIDNDAVTFAKTQNIATDRLVGRDTAGTGDEEEITVSGGIEFTGSAGIQTSALTGDATKAAGGTAMTVVKASGTFSLPGDISPSQITANQNDYEPPGFATASRLRIFGSGPFDLTGMKAGADGELKILDNIGAFTFTLKDDSGSSVVANRFQLSNDYRLMAEQSAALQYDMTSARWRVLAPIQTFTTSPVTSIASGPEVKFIAGSGISITAAAPNEVTFVGSLPGTSYYPTQITGDTNNYNIGTLNVITTAYLNADTAWSVTGIVYPGSACGYIWIAHNNGSVPILFPSQSASSTAGNRLLSAENMVIKPNESIAYQYDCTALRWRLLWRTTCCWEPFTVTYEQSDTFIPTFTGWVEISGWGTGGQNAPDVVGVIGGGGGGGGAFAKKNAYPVVAGSSYTVTISSPTGAAIFLDGATTLMSAAGGGSASGSTKGTKGLASASTGNIKNNGGDGADAANRNGGGGGGSGGLTSAGGDASGVTGGSAGSGGGAAGGAGAPYPTNLYGNGSAPGGGCGGPDEITGLPSPSNGAAGRITITRIA